MLWEHSPRAYYVRNLLLNIMGNDHESGIIGIINCFLSPLKITQVSTISSLLFFNHCLISSPWKCLVHSNSSFFCPTTHTHTNQASTCSTSYSSQATTHVHTTIPSGTSSIPSLTYLLVAPSICWRAQHWCRTERTPRLHNHWVLPRHSHYHQSCCRQCQ